MNFVYTHEMLILIKHIKNQMPAPLQPMIKFSSKSLIHDLNEFRETSSDEDLNQKIEDLFALVRAAGGKVGRVEKPLATPIANGNKPKRIYRGRVVEA